jgi:CRISPR-associated endoribonuclease Cas6
MQRIAIHADKTPQTYRYLDSVHAALVNGLTAAGIDGEKLIGRDAQAWTFACKGYAKPGGEMAVKSILLSTPDEEIGKALLRIKPQDIRKKSSNGDILDFSRARIRSEQRMPPPGTREACFCFASRFALIGRKAGREKTWFIQSPAQTDFAAALKAGLDRRAGRELDIRIGIDRLTLATQGAPRPVSLRKSGSRRVMIPAFNMPVSLEGNPEDIAWAYFAGLGAKTHLGFGCPILPN